jgi:hypothetical protein
VTGAEPIGPRGVIDLPVLVTGFNRPDLLSPLLDQLRRLGVSKLYVSLDGPRRDRPEDLALTSACQGIVAAVDWPATIRVRVNSENLGCGRAMASALDWFFSHEDSGVILEDDVVPSAAFFDFTSHMLDLFRQDPRVLTISTANTVPLEHITCPRDPYRFSGVPQVWGWASWADRWNGYRFELGDWRRGWPLVDRWQAMGGRIGLYLYWSRVFDRVARHEMDTWDYQLVYLAMRTRATTVIPRVSLVDNVGFGQNSTHTKEKAVELIKGRTVGPYYWSCPAVDRRADRWMLRHAYGVSPSGLWRRFRQRLPRSATSHRADPTMNAANRSHEATE